MARILFVLMLLPAVSSFAQDPVPPPEVHLVAGVVDTWMSQESVGHVMGMRAGMEFEIPLAQFYSMVLGVAYNPKGGVLSWVPGSPTLRLHYVELSLIGMIHVDLSEDFRISFFFGPTQAQKLGKTNAPFIRLDERRIATIYGIDAGVRVPVMIEEWKLFLEVRREYGMTTIYEAGWPYFSERYAASRSLQFTVGYVF